MLSFKQFILLENNNIENLKKSLVQSKNPKHDELRDGLLLQGSDDQDMYQTVIGRYDVRTRQNAWSSSNRTLRAYQNLPSQIPATHHIVDELAKADHTKDKKYLPQIADWYAKGHIRHEDLGDKESHEREPNHRSVYGVLSLFSSRSKYTKEDFPPVEHPETRQMMNGNSLSSYRHMTFGQFRNRVRTHLGLDNAKEVSLDEHPDVQLVDEKNGTKLYHIKSKEGAIHAAKACKGDWCTGWEDKNNMFHKYSHGLHVLAGKDGEHHQIHIDSYQIMDRTDSAIEPEHLARKYPEIKDMNYFKSYLDKDGHGPFMHDSDKEKMVDAFHSQLKSWKEPEYFGEKFGRELAEKAIITNASHDQLKRMNPNDTKGFSKHFGNLVKATRMYKFGENRHQFNGQLGSREHHEHLFKTYDDLVKINDSIMMQGHRDLRIGIQKHFNDLDNEWKQHFAHQTHDGHNRNVHDNFAKATIVSTYKSRSNNPIEMAKYHWDNHIKR